MTRKEIEAALLSRPDDEPFNSDEMFMVIRHQYGDDVADLIEESFDADDCDELERLATRHDPVDLAAMLIEQLGFVSVH
jgi:hypothetical protein